MNKQIKYILYIVFMLCIFALFFEQKVDAFSLDTDALYDGNFEFGGGTMYNAVGDMKFGNTAPQEDTFWNSIYKKYGTSIIMFSGFVSLIFVIFFIINITKFATAAGNPQTRKQAMQTIMWTGIAAAIFGGVTLLVGLSTTLFK